MSATEFLAGIQSHTLRTEAKRLPAGELDRRIERFVYRFGRVASHEKALIELRELIVAARLDAVARINQ
jgi:hypothetical protein